MNDRSKNKTILGVERSELAYSEGLRTFMLSVYNYMALGLGLTGGCFACCGFIPNTLACHHADDVTLYHCPHSPCILFKL